MSEVPAYAPWWRLSITGHCIHVNDDGSYWWWDRVRMFIGARRPHFYFRAKGVFRPRGRMCSMAWHGKCSAWESPTVTRAFTYRGLNRKADRSRHSHFLHCQHPENHQAFDYAVAEARKYFNG